MENSEAAYRIKPASDISNRVRRLNTLGAQSRDGAFDRLSESQQTAVLRQQVDELASAVRDLAGYIAARDGIDLGDRS